MPYEKFLKDNLIKKQAPDFNQIADQLKRSGKDLKIAQQMLEVDSIWAFTIAYQAMIRAGKALMYSRGYLPTAKQSHKTVVEFTGTILGKEYAVLISRFNRMRRRRHEFIYEGINHMTETEARTSIETAKDLIDKIIALVKAVNPEKELF
jgi:uncharacterized protein (UPF0332 family)